MGKCYQFQKVTPSYEKKERGKLNAIVRKDGIFVIREEKRRFTKGGEGLQQMKKIILTFLELPSLKKLREGWSIK